MGRNSKKLNLNDHTMFRYSTPGYYFKDVEDIVKKQEVSLAKAMKKIKEDASIMAEKDSRITYLENELRDLHLQLSNIEVPPIEDAVSSFVLDEFKNSNRTQAERDADISPTKELGKVEDNSVKKRTKGGTSFTIAQ